jgi:hypothetical protein
MHITKQVSGKEEKEKLSRLFRCLFGVVFAFIDPKLTLRFDAAAFAAVSSA